MQVWKFIYTTLSHYKKAVNKNGSINPVNGTIKYVYTEGKDYSEAYNNARKECSFKDCQLIGSMKID